MSGSDISRRDFVADGSKLAAAALIVPRHVLGGTGYQAPSDTLNIAIVGAGGMGAQNAQQLGSENIVAVCDVDFGLVSRRADGSVQDGDGNPRPEGVRWKAQLESAAKYHDFRVMLDQETGIEAVLIATPDHAQGQTESGRRLAFALPRVDDQKPLLDSFLGDLGVLYFLALRHLGAMALKVFVLDRFGHVLPFKMRGCPATTRTTLLAKAAIR